jgi:replicative DNA helicase
MGKSSFVMNVAEHIAQTANVLFISLEMSRKEYAQRMLFSRANVDVNKINSGTITDDDITAVCNQKDYLDSLNLFIETKTPCRVSDIELAIINLQASKGSCDLVVVDYLQLLTPMGKNSKNREVEVAEMSRDLKSLAIKYQVPIIVLSQLSRGLESRENKRPMLSDLRESGAIEQDADVVTFLYRNEYYFPDDPASRGAAELLIRKNRGGQNNRDIDLCWQPSKVKFMEASNREV